MAELMPNIPYKVAVVDDDGFLSGPWVGFFKQLFLRVGGSIAPSLSDVASASSVTALQSAVTSIQTSISTIQANIVTIQSQINDIGQGRDL